MNPEEMNDRIDELTTQADEMSAQLEDAREQRNDLLRQRFDIKEQRRYFRTQLREAKAEGNAERAGKIETRLSELDGEIEDLDRQVEELESSIDAAVEEIEEVMDQVEEIQPQEPDRAQEKDEPREEPEKDVLTETMNKLNSLLTRGFKKMADTIENIDFEKVGENVSNAASKAYKTVEGAATGAARNVESAWNEAKENREKPGGIGDYRSSGSSTIDGGCYNRITVSGACKISSDLVCREMRLSGSVRACGGVDCNGPIRTTGSFQVGNKLIAGSLSSSGSTKVQSDLEAGAVRSTGGLHVGGNLKAADLYSTGGLHVTGDVEADTVTTTGTLEIGGMLNADDVDIQVALGSSTIGSIGGANVKIYPSASAGLLKTLGAATGTLTCTSIEGDTLDLAAVKADVVRGATVIIRAGSMVDQVEYTDACTVEEGAVVGHQAQV